MADPYTNLRLVQQRLQDLAKQCSSLPPSPERTLLHEALDALSSLAREASTVAHHVNQLQDRAADLSTAMGAVVEQVFGHSKGEA